METRLTAYLLEDFLHEHFTSKKEMAEHMDVPYRMLLRVFTMSCSKKDVRCIMDKVIQYCVENKIPLERILHSFCN